MDAPFAISDHCCAEMKKKPFHIYQKQTGKKPIVGTLAHESRLRYNAYLNSGCNAFHRREPMSKPMSFWLEQDVLRYLKFTGISYCSIYGDIIEEKGKLKMSGADRTGCMFCMFGVHREKYPNRFQRMEQTHPKHYDYIKNTPYRRAAKFEVKSIKSRMKLDYKKALKENPKLKSNVLSRFMQKRKIKRQYAAALRNAQKTGQTLKATGGIVAKASKIVTAIVRKNPIFLLKIGGILLILIIIMSLFTMCMGMFSNTTGVVGLASYAAADECINQVSLSYSESNLSLQHHTALNPKAK